MHIPGWKPLNYLELHPVEHFFQSKKRHNVFWQKLSRCCFLFKCHWTSAATTSAATTSAATTAEASL
jgi:hypothetical protein